MIGLELFGSIGVLVWIRPEFVTTIEEREYRRGAERQGLPGSLLTMSDGRTFALILLPEEVALTLRGLRRATDGDDVTHAVVGGDGYWVPNY